MESSSPKGDYFDYIDIDAIDNQRNIITSPKRIPVKNAPSRASRKTHRGDVLFSMVRPYLRNIARVDYDNCIASTGFYVCHSSGLVTSKYCFILMLSNYVVEGLNQYMKGDNSPSINNKHITSWIYPVPPIPEQERISAAVDELLNWVDDLSDSEKRLFESIATIKAKILGLAIHGKLVPQNPADEPALESLKRINPDFQTSHNLHYDSVPKGWCECRLHDCVDILNGFAFKSNEYSNTGVRVMRITNVQNGFISDDDPKFFPLMRINEIERYILKEGDLLMSLTGNVGRVAFVEKELLPAALNQRVACIRTSLPPEVLRFIFYLCQTREFADACVSSGKGVAQLNISTEWLNNYAILLPPINEIRRILMIVSDYFNRLDEIVNTCQ